MADERTGVAQSISDSEVDELELIEDLEPIEEESGAYLRQPASSGESAPPPARMSSPPPVPPEARQSRPPEARPGSVPPLSRARSHSGMFRIEHPSSPPPVPRSSIPPASAAGSIAAPEATILPVADGDELRETHAYAQRLRLMLRLREDRIRELEAALREQRERADRLERQTSLVPPPPAADDLKRISGVGPAFERALHAAGVTTFEQIAAWSSLDIERIAAQLRTVPQRIARGRWVERARELSGGAAPDAVAVETD